MSIQNFVCIGAQKSGTTTLADILAQHPDIYIPVIKETKFFLFEEDFMKGLNYYTNTYFGNYKNQKACGEFDPDYLLFPETADRIKNTLGAEIKILVVLRNPANRAYSHYLMTKRKGLESFSFQEAIEKEQSRKSSIKERKIYAYLERGMYGKQLNIYLNTFHRENFLFIRFEEDLMKNKEQTLIRIQQFLGVEIQKLNLNIHRNEAGESKNEVVTNLLRKPNFAKRILKSFFPSKEGRIKMRKFFIQKNMQAVVDAKLSDEMKQTIIKKYFEADIQLTEALTGLNLQSWK